MTEDGPAKRPRGRPRLTNPEQDRMYAILHGPGTSRRKVLTWVYISRALHGIDEGSPMRRWYINSETGNIRGTIMAELGRVEDDAARLFLANHVYERRMPTGQAVALIRRVRTGRAGPAPGRLEIAVLAAINAHAARYPATTADEILDALAVAAASVRAAHDG